jgi:hypothetical protein
MMVYRYQTRYLSISTTIYVNTYPQRQRSAQSEDPIYLESITIGGGKACRSVVPVIKLGFSRVKISRSHSIGTC